MYLKLYFLYIFTWFSLSVGPPGPNQKAYFVKISLTGNFVVLIRVSYGSSSRSTGNGSGSTTLVVSTNKVHTAGMAAYKPQSRVMTLASSWSSRSVRYFLTRLTINVKCVDNISDLLTIGILTSYVKQLLSNLPLVWYPISDIWFWEF
jgi:hypothetical protein